ncbi:MAG: DegQ family serine endoprotease [Deltaproteobacteria bacterium]|nr:DegQ family serine endoprotease [Deltaproteobacteria bacterium]
MKPKTMSWIAASCASVLIAGAIAALAADWFPWGGSKSAPTPEPAPTAAPAASAPAPASRAMALPSFADIAAGAEHAVVNISTTQTVKNEGFGGPMPGPGGRGGRPGPFGGGDPFEEFFRRFMPQMPRSFKTRSLGSGFVIDPDGTIVTNNHVVEHADEILVKLSSGDHRYKAKVLGTDPKTDLAVIKIDPAGASIPTLQLGDSDGLRVGDWVVAIGNPFGLEQTVTAGIVSAKGRAIGQGPYDDFIQTDASINPGNSGGPLLNVRGDVVGINSAIFSETGGNLGIGFAIPSNLSKSIVAQLKSKGKVVRGWLGVMIQDVTEDLARSFKLSEPQGALVSGVKEDGPGAKGGLERGDVILEYDGQKVKASHDLPAMVAATSIGKDVEVKVLREGQEKSLRVKIGEMPKGEAEAGGAEGGGEPSGEQLGLMVGPVGPDVARELGIEPGVGVLVKGVKSGSVAEDAGLRPGDVILEVDRKALKSVDAFTEAVGKGKAGESLLFLVRRGDSTLFLALKR